jgi:two-component sensor histidine kinase
MTSAPTTAELERRVVILPSSSADGAVASQVLAAAGMEITRCVTMEDLCATAEAGAAVLVLAEEALAGTGFRCLADFLDRQPAWSDIPLIVLTTRRREATAYWRIVGELSSVRNAMLLERPMQTEMFLQAVRVALRTRERQYQLRTYIAERESLLAQREMLLREVQHRVKNNLQMMQSLVRMSAARAPPQAKPLFADLVGRISALGQLHTRVYASENLTGIDAAAYLAGIVNQTATAFAVPQGCVRIVKHLEPILMDVDTAMPVGLIATELLTNAYKYAFPEGRPGEIRIELALRSGMVELMVADDGVGLPEAVSSVSTGLQLVRGLAGQIGGTFTTLTAPGTRCILRFPFKECPQGPA